ncbi:hypothetical protein IW140_006267 [Coemansia sp. RSA 1813]|nr:hypothetical protein EV178_006169 [Coemansia sp. RSA 1646]KAJ1765346.1 hypothetical protein LPJ74_006389 [Coemansia sp. RSA 1843]KAJ2085744.1 hypothetical protein IW138_006139 [Coemansia sp. RSA 986]KAJ2211896.1 hypothetical protein EV179_005131 [Coemansia sp. RSA 487]KAJ2562964.1 hypothetical protein IW140_006267 [Coemansia sp. RSA 1813]
MSNDSTHIPLSLRRKIVIALDADALQPPVLGNQGGNESSEEVNEATKRRFSTFKTVAWTKANIIRPTEDHVFLTTCINPEASGPLDTAAITNMWNSLFTGQENHTNRVKEAEIALKRIAEALHCVGVSASIEVVLGNAAEKIPEYVHVHRGELLIVQAPVRSVLATTLAYSWADTCANMAECPTVIVKQSDLPDNVAVALDPPLPTPTQNE